MSDTAPEFIAPPEALAPADPAVEAASKESEPANDWQDKFLGQRKVNRDLERKLHEALGRLKEFEDSNKSEAELAAARAEAAERALSEMTTKALRLEVATELGLPAELHEFLTGNDEESMRSQAEKLVEKLAAATAAQQPGKPKPDPSQGARPDGAPPQLTRADLAGMSPEAITKAKAEGRLNDLLGIK